MLSPDVSRTRFFELTIEEWAVLTMGAAVFVALLMAWQPDVTFWPALGLGFTAIAFGHLCMTVRRFVAFPDLIVAAACLQWIVAPWLAETYRSTMMVFRMTLPSDDYLRYAVPATIALWVGLHLPASRKLAKSWEMPAIEPLSKRARRTLDLTIVVGLIVDTYGYSFPVEFYFLVYLLSLMRFVGALGWMVTRTPGWPWRVALVMLHLTAVQSTGGMFYLVVHWGGYFLLVYAFMKRWRWLMVVALIVGVMGLSLLQTVKPTFRNSLTQEQVSGPVEAFTRLTAMMWDHAKDGRVVDPDANLGDTLVRFNQGWIIARIMRRVPADEPYARGGTLLDAAVFSIVPRFLFPNKREGASQELFQKYTGVELVASTRMGLGIIGELYANFGLMGGVVATFIYGLVMGWLFLFFADRAQRNPLWWAAASTVLLPGVEPGFNLEDIANHVVKAAIVFYVLWKTVPAIRQVLAAPAVHEYADDDQGDQDFDGVSSSFDDVVADHGIRP